MRLITFQAASLLLTTGLAPSLGLGQTLTFDPRSQFDRAPLASARAAGMAEALTPVADGPDAVYYNPAAIGGIRQKEEGTLSDFYFPYFSIAGDSHALALAKELRSGKNLEDDAVTTELLRTHSGANPYARVSLFPHAVYRRMFVGYTYDVRASSAPHADDATALDVDERSQRGPIIGYSLASDRKDLYWGLSIGYLERSETQGSFPLATLNQADDRKRAFHEVNRIYKGSPIHTGVLWNFQQQGLRGSLGVVVRNLTGTRYDSSSTDTPTYKDPEDLTIAASISPSLGRWGYWNLVGQVSELTRNDIETKEKFRLGSEWTFGDAFGSKSTCALRVGYRYAGLSWGASLRLGILGLNLASYPEDVGLGNTHVIERRSIVNLAINLVD